MTIGEMGIEAPTDTRYVGRSVARVDGPAKTTGVARYAAEHFYPDLAYAALVHATIARGRIITIDTTPARAVPDVIAVLTHENAPAMKAPGKLNPLEALGNSTSV